MSPLAKRPRIIQKLPSFEIKGQYNPYVQNLVELVITNRIIEANYAFNGVVQALNT